MAVAACGGRWQVVARGGRWVAGGGRWQVAGGGRWWQVVAGGDRWWQVVAGGSPTETYFIHMLQGLLQDEAGRMVPDNKKHHSLWWHMQSMA
jgi:hypothetical protein